MSTKADYTAEEWAQVVSGPFFASFYVVMSDLNVFFVKEITAMTRAMMDSAAKSPSDLIKAIAVDISSENAQEDVQQNLNELKSEEDPGTLKASIISDLTSSADTVSAKSAEDGEVYRKWLVYLAQATAEGSREGGFLGIGAVRVSDKEKQALDELAETLGVGAES